jgi:hypothetical protein
MELRTTYWTRSHAALIGFALGLIVAGTAAVGQIVLIGLSPASAHGFRPLELGLYVLIAAATSLGISLAGVAVRATLLDPAGAFVWGAASAVAIVLASVTVGWSESSFANATGARVIFATLVLAGFTASCGVLAVVFRALGLWVHLRFMKGLPLK